MRLGRREMFTFSFIIFLNSLHLLQRACVPFVKIKLKFKKHALTSCENYRYERDKMFKLGKLKTSNRGRPFTHHNISMKTRTATNTPRARERHVLGYARKGMLEALKVHSSPILKDGE